MKPQCRALGAAGGRPLSHKIRRKYRANIRKKQRGRGVNLIPRAACAARGTVLHCAVPAA
ncbi:MAG: hypothetical protein IBGAMO2_340040 [Arenicellales bacterium IbO2]|nr:MAG: hypothetical protein IBGAMO2_340040 [Arenicellales bacterium IbO2]